jgi:hypothetical protein
MVQWIPPSSVVVQTCQKPVFADSAHTAVLLTSVGLFGCEQPRQHNIAAKELATLAFLNRVIVDNWNHLPRKAGTILCRYGSLWPSRWRGLSLGVPQVMISSSRIFIGLKLWYHPPSDSVSGKS